MRHWRAGSTKMRNPDSKTKKSHVSRKRTWKGSQRINRKAERDKWEGKAGAEPWRSNQSRKDIEYPVGPKK